MRSKRQDPLHVLLEYIATVSTDTCYIFTLILTWTVQRAPSDCDMALVHDDDLVRILEDENVSTGHP